MPYARKRKRVYTRRRASRKRAKRRYSPYFRKRRSALAKAYASRRRYRNRKLLAIHRPGTLSFGNKYIKDTRKAWLFWRNQLDQTIIASTESSSPLEVQFGEVVNTTSALFNGVDEKQAPTYFSENWDKYSSLYQQVYVKNCNITVQFSSMDNRVFSADPQVTTSTLNPTTYIVGIAIFRAPLFKFVNPTFKWETLRKMGNCVYKKYTAGVTRALTVTAKIDLSKALQQYDFALRCHQVMPINSAVNDVATNFPVLQPEETRCVAYPFVVPLVKSAAEGAAYTINYKTSVSKLCVFSRPQSELLVIRNAAPLVGGTQLYPPVGTLLNAQYRPIPVDPSGDGIQNPYDVIQDERLEVLEANDDEQDENIQTNAQTIQSVDQTLGQTIDDLNVHINTQFPNVH